MRARRLLIHYHSVALYRRRLPHLYRDDQPIFLTWRLHDSLPFHRFFPDPKLSSGKQFAALDRLLDEARTGPFYLRQPEVADMFVNSLHYSAEVLDRYALHAFAVMPNHVHILVSPHVPLPKLTKTLKGFTAKRANQLLGLTGSPFWQEESYDHLVRDEREFDRIRGYIEQNPVRAGFVSEASQYHWSSAGWPTGRSPTDQEVRPTR
jgi:putative DNA methylase